MKTSFAAFSEISSAGNKQSYNYFSGDYSKVKLTDRLMVEAFAMGHLGKLLLARRGLEVFLDLGSGGSMTAMRIAERFAPAIKAGKLAVVATNQTNSRLDYIHKLPKGPARTEALRLYKRTTPLIHELNTSFPANQPLTIVLPNGEIVDLTRRVTFAHERKAVSYWGDKNAALAVGELIANTGIHMVSENDLHKQRLNGSQAAVTGYYAQRGFTQSHEVITNEGTLSNSFYNFYYGPRSHLAESLAL